MASSVAAAGRPITIEYALTRAEVTSSYLRAISQSPEYLRRVITVAAVCALAQAAFRVMLSQHIGASEILSAVVVFAIILALLPVGLFMRAKTERRTLTISPAGISTFIGRKSGEIPWKSVKVVKDGGTFLLIARGSGNAFFIPNRAFASPDDRARFLDQMQVWRGHSE